MNSASSSIAVCILPRPPLNSAIAANYPDYLLEILNHAGLCFARVDVGELAGRLSGIGLLVTVGAAELDEPTRRALADWVTAGGAWLSLGGICGMGETLGVAGVPPAIASWAGGATLIGEGYLVPAGPGDRALGDPVQGHPAPGHAVPDHAPQGYAARRDPALGHVAPGHAAAAHPALGHLRRPLHYFGGLAVKSTGAAVVAGSLDAHGRPSGRDVLFEHATGKGRAMLLAADVTGTIVRIQQGLAVTRDGVPAPDGSAPIADGVLKSGDGGVLDWIFDRHEVSGVPGYQAFIEPIADLWREVVLRCIYHLATTQNVAVPLLWLYPRALPAIAHLSHDSDNNEPDKARALLDALREADIRSTWCIILPGYDAALIRAIAQAGHELAAHYDAMTPGQAWGEDEFRRQVDTLAEMFGHQPVTNKNHYLRWEGDVEFFDWCVRRGIQLDQSKGPSKTGEAGFNFGSCHPHFPVAFDGRSIDVLELPTHTQDLPVTGPPALLDALLAGARAVHGVMHILYHPAHIQKPDVRETLLAAIAAAKAQGMEWWTAAMINDWERARRRAAWSDYAQHDAGPSVSIECAADLPDATLAWLGTGTASIDGVDAPASTMEVWGFTFATATATLRRGRRYVTRLTAL